MFGKLVLAKGAKDHLTQQLLEDLPRGVRRRLAEVDWERAVLPRARLQRRSPAKRGVGGLTLFLLGALTGGLAALMLAPRPGAELRDRVRTRAQNLMGSRHGTYPQAPAEA